MRSLEREGRLVNFKHNMEITSLQGKKALIVEDNEALAYILSEYMEDCGVMADFARNGKEACDMVAIHTYDFILMDIYMPVMNGLEATAKIISFAPLSIIIVVTSSSERLECERMKSVGAKDCIVKPVSKEKLINSVTKNIAALAA
jgi:two-component system, sensor histidine kinase